MTDYYGKRKAEGTVAAFENRAYASGEGETRSNDRPTNRTLSSGLADAVDRAIDYAYDAQKRKK